MKIFRNNEMIPYNQPMNYFNFHWQYKETKVLQSEHILINYAVTQLQNLYKLTNMKHAASKPTNKSPDDEDYDEACRHKRRTVIYSESYNPQEDLSTHSINKIDKTEEELKILNACVRQCLLFKSLDNEQIYKVLDAMFEKQVKPGDVIIKQGDYGDNFYVIEVGVFEATVTENDEEKVTARYENSGFFGELSLMYNMPRAATVRALTAGKLWAMDRQRFRRIVVKEAFKKRKLYEKLIETVPILEPLEPYERMTLADALEPIYFKDGDIIIEQGKEANGMFFIESGKVKVTKFDKKVKEIVVLEAGGYFGEYALVAKTPRQANVIALGNVKLAFLSVDAFERLLGPCMDIMKRQIQLYEEQVENIFGNDLSDARIVYEEKNIHGKK